LALVVLNVASGTASGEFSRNSLVSPHGFAASKTKPAKLFAASVVDTNETELTIPFGNLQGT